MKLLLKKKKKTAAKGERRRAHAALFFNSSFAFFNYIIQSSALPPQPPPKESFARRYKFLWPMLLAVNLAVGGPILFLIHQLCNSLFILISYTFMYVGVY